MHAATLLTFIAIVLSSAAASDTQEFFSQDVILYDSTEDDLILNAQDQYELDVREEYELNTRNYFLELRQELFARNGPQLNGCDRDSTLVARSELGAGNSLQRRGCIVGKICKWLSKDKVDSQELASLIEGFYANLQAEFKQPDLDMSAFMTKFLVTRREVNKSGCSRKPPPKDIAEACAKWDPFETQARAAYLEWIHHRHVSPPDKPARLRLNG